jgi:hypothetical protein
MAKGAGDGRKAESGQGMDDRDIMQVHGRVRGAGCNGIPACLGAVGETGTQAGSTTPCGLKRAQEADEFLQHFRSVIIVDFHSIDALLASKGVRRVFHSMITSARPGVAEGGKRADTHADTSRVTQAACWKAWLSRRRDGASRDGVKPHVSKLGGDVVEGLGAVREPTSVRSGRMVALRARWTSVGNHPCGLWGEEAIWGVDRNL